MVAGGVIPEEDIAELKKQGVVAIFTMGTDTSEIVEFIRHNVRVS